MTWNPTGDILQQQSEVLRELSIRLVELETEVKVMRGILKQHNIRIETLEDGYHGC